MLHFRLFRRRYPIHLLLVCTLFCCSSCNKDTTATQTEKFQVIKPMEKTVSYENEYVAEILSAQHVEVRNRVKGYIERVHVDEGQSVRAGQVLFTISSKTFRQEVQKAQSVTKNALAELKSVRIELENAKRLFDKNIVSKPEVDLLEAKADALQAKVEEAQSDEQQTKLNLSYSEIKAPFSGIINRIPYKAGSLLEEGTSLTTISNSNSIFAYFNVSEKDYLGYTRSEQQGKSKAVSLKLADGSVYAHAGVVETTESEFDKNTGTIAFRARFPNPENLLKHGSSGKVMVKTELTNAMLVPQKSTFEVQENVYVFVVDKNNKVQLRRIVPAFRLPHLYAISSGLLADDQFIYEGVQRVKEGVTIIPEVVSFPPLYESQNNL